VLLQLQAVLIQQGAFTKSILTSAQVSGAVLLQSRAFAQLVHFQRMFHFFCFKQNCSYNHSHWKRQHSLLALSNLQSICFIKANWI